MSIQSWILGIVLSLIAVLVIVSWVVFKTWSVKGVIALIIYLLFVAVTTYDTECLVEGKCMIWSWVRTVLYAVIPTIVIVIYIYALATKDKAAIQKNVQPRIQLNPGVSWGHTAEESRNA